ncbi:hypothetical protein YDYSG_19890 [Paenibacillus tyrfis]|uniref:hypothetical protein n=1 Tax=Paenibacillus tyrfis TaxID=1501230 RepID=UPI00249094DD|nr:hypothetical protein [Paenibacillus tyrfis]GLI05959.1 hypothetical protein YDYSG_19890 [Paenibacillus tyrfis]
MTRQEALKHFWETYVKDKQKEYIEKAEEEYRSRKDELAKDFIESFRRICLNIKEMQSAGKKAKIGYINYSMRRTYLMERKHEHVVEAFDKDWYFDTYPCRGTYDSEWVFKYLDALEDELEQLGKKYMGKIIKPDIERIKLEAAGAFNRLVVDMASYAMPGAIRLKEYQDMACEPGLEVRVGEHKGISEVVYSEESV